MILVGLAYHWHCDAHVLIIQNGLQLLSAMFQYVSKAVISNKDETLEKDKPLSAPTFL